MGPARAGYLDQLVAYDNAFGRLLHRLKSDGINKDNTLFVVTVEEGDHFAATAPDGPCDGVKMSCTYSARPRSPRSTATSSGSSRPTTRAVAPARRRTSASTADLAPNVYITGNPARDSSTAAHARAGDERHERDEPALEPGGEPVRGDGQTRSRRRLLHMVTADAKRTADVHAVRPRATTSSNASSTTPCANNDLSTASSCRIRRRPNQTFAWNHGGIQPESATRGSAGSGRGSRRRASTGQDFWTDHTDVRPTILALLGLKDDYVSRRPRRSPSSSRATHSRSHSRAARSRARPGLEGRSTPRSGRSRPDTLTASTGALASHTLGDSTYTKTENAIQALTAERDALAAKIRLALWNAEFNDQKIDEKEAKNWIGLGGLPARPGAARLAAKFQSSRPTRRSSRRSTTSSSSTRRTTASTTSTAAGKA